MNEVGKHRKAGIGAAVLCGGLFLAAKLVSNQLLLEDALWVGGAILLALLVSDSLVRLLIRLAWIRLWQSVLVFLIGGLIFGVIIRLPLLLDIVRGRVLHPRLELLHPYAHQSVHNLILDALTWSLPAVVFWWLAIRPHPAYVRDTSRMQAFLSAVSCALAAVILLRLLYVLSFGAG